MHNNFFSITIVLCSASLSHASNKASRHASVPYLYLCADKVDFTGVNKTTSPSFKLAILVIHPFKCFIISFNKCILLPLSLPLIIIYVKKIFIRFTKSLVTICNICLICTTLLQNTQILINKKYIIIWNILPYYCFFIIVMVLSLSMLPQNSHRATVNVFSADKAVGMSAIIADGVPPAVLPDAEHLSQAVAFL